MKKIVTHSGSFHPDDVFAVATLQLHLGKDNTEVIRTRDEALIAQADWVVDVGGIYDDKKQRFDHHQNGAPVRDNGIPYAAFGLVWKHLGERVAGSREVAQSIEERLAQQIDAGDNGITLYDLNEYNVFPYELYNVIGSFKPVWGSDTTDDEAFLEAVDFARKLLVRIITHAQADTYMREYIQKGFATAEDKSVLVFDQPVHRNYFIEYPVVKVVVYPSSSSEEEKWNASVIPQDFGTFDSRVTFPDAWAGLKDEKLASVSGIDDAVFCHKAKFLFVAKSKESALKAAQMAE